MPLLLPSLALLALALASGGGGAAAQVVPTTVPKIINSFCDFNRDFQLDSSGAMIGGELNYTLCMDVKSKSYAITCIKGVRCPPGPDTAKVVYTGAGASYNVDWSGKCTKKACPACDPPDGMPFSFLLLDDDSRGVARRVGSTTLEGVEVDHYTHVRGPGMIMNWYTRNVSTAADQPKQLVRNAFNHRSVAARPLGLPRPPRILTHSARGSPSPAPLLVDCCFLCLHPACTRWSRPRHLNLLPH
jgi:hypothetical protein|eukprot:COSAG06_NODE_2386_length_6971_cov_19.704744_2_plen_244_part_00